ncbi:hypothetical protein KZX32_06910 [Corynebacterium kefirresidentii]|uniref:hypothetical protein n=1 Tax=Corynebacterium kefirresidentii TaxID=1979527 RepID=UPI002004B081|nr:hypothetical protein [Corynebacterium kefirresidentii]MCK6083217.1 hypothetical protein [Corynebacterium kefirresidentii]
MTIKTCGSPVGQAAAAVEEYIAETIERRVFKEHKPNDGLHLHLNWQAQSPENPMFPVMVLAEHFDSAVGGLLTYDLESSRFFINLFKEGKYWLEEEEVFICCYNLLWTSYYLDNGQKRAADPNISRVTEVVTALKALRVKTER